MDDGALMKQRIRDLAVVALLALASALCGGCRGCEVEVGPAHQDNRCADEATLIREGLTNAVTCPHKLHRVEVHGTPKGALVICRCERPDGGQ